MAGLGGARIVAFFAPITAETRWAIAEEMRAFGKAIPAVEARLSSARVAPDFAVVAAEAGFTVAEVEGTFGIAIAPVLTRFLGARVGLRQRSQGQEQTESQEDRRRRHFFFFGFLVSRITGSFAACVILHREFYPEVP